MNPKQGTMMSRAVLVWGAAFDQLDSRDDAFPVTTRQLGNMLASRAYGHYSIDQWGCAYCVALFLLNNDLHHKAPDAHSKPFGIKGGEKAPAWKLIHWHAAYVMHETKALAELQEVEALKQSEGIMTDCMTLQDWKGFQPVFSALEDDVYYTTNEIAAQFLRKTKTLDIQDCINLMGMCEFIAKRYLLTTFSGKHVETIVDGQTIVNKAFHGLAWKTAVGMHLDILDAMGDTKSLFMRTLDQISMKNPVPPQGTRLADKDRSRFSE